MANHSLDQFQVFVAVVDAGGFAAAARKLGRAQSAITYAIRGLEDQTGLVLFDRAQYRPTLTDAGRSLLPRARRLLEDLEEFNLHAEGFAHGVEAGLAIVVNEFADLAPVLHALGSLHRKFPSVPIKLTLRPFGDDLDLLRSGQAQLGIVSAITQIGNEFDARLLAEHELVAVAAPTHPLAAVAGPIGLDQLRGHMQIVWTRDRTDAKPPDWGVHALDAWHVTDLDMKLQLMRLGVGWGSLPLHRAENDIAAGRLKRLEMESWEGRDRMPTYHTHVVRLRKFVPGPAARHLVDVLLGREAA